MLQEKPPWARAGLAPPAVRRISVAQRRKTAGERKIGRPSHQGRLPQRYHAVRDDHGGWPLGSPAGGGSGPQRWPLRAARTGGSALRAVQPGNRGVAGFTRGNHAMKAHDILTAAQSHMKDRVATYDRPEGERSMGATVEAFKAVTGDGLMNTEERGWLFMELLKAVRSQQGAYRADCYEDGAAYVALAGEAAARDRKKPIIRELYTEADEERMDQIGTNDNEGTHYAQALPAGYSWADAPPDATVLVMSTITGAYHWADAFSNGARIYGASFDR